MHVSPSISDFLLMSHYIFERVLCVVGFKKSKYLCRNVHRKMGAFFIRFVTFTDTLVYSVVWNQYFTKLWNYLIFGVMRKIIILSLEAWCMVTWNMVRHGRKKVKFVYVWYNFFFKNRLYGGIYTRDGRRNDKKKHNNQPLDSGGQSSIWIPQEIYYNTWLYRVIIYIFKWQFQ